MAAPMMTMRMAARLTRSTGRTLSLSAASRRQDRFAPVAARSFVPRRAFSSDQISMTFVDGEGNETPVVAKEGDTLLDIAQDNDVELEGACGGELACSTCHLIFEKAVYDQLPEISEEEEDMLDLAWGLTDTCVGTYASSIALAWPSLMSGAVLFCIGLDWAARSTRPKFCRARASACRTRARASSRRGV
jgi:ferredoxin-2, mitochondrial